jgi:hypothetical protein
MGSGLNGQVIDLNASSGDIYVGGGFYGAGGVAGADGIAKWNGSNWSALGNGLASGSVYYIAISGSDVYAGGSFTDGDGNPKADKIAFYRYPYQTFCSRATQDGWVLESSENSSVGGTMNSTGGTFYAGDDVQDRQYRSILSYDTSSLPSNAIITKVTLKIRKQGLVGTNPITTHGNLVVDVKIGSFSNNGILQLTDFQAAASGIAIGNFPKAPVNGWYIRVWTSGIFNHINKAGTTQFRLRFLTDDDNDATADYLKFYSGDTGKASYWPRLIVEYSVP